jgi:hypothetical protein
MLLKTERRLNKRKILGKTVFCIAKYENDVKRY